MKKTITIDARWLVGGIGTYTRHLLQGLSENRNGFQINVITREQHADQVRQWCQHVTIVNLPIYTIREQWQIPLASSECDLLHVPHYNAPLFHRRALVISIHDVIHLADPGYRTTIKAWAYAWPMLHLAARKADHIVTVSKFSKSQIVERLGVSESKVSAIYLGTDGGFRGIDRQQAAEAVARALGRRAPYVLYVGNLKPHKNVLSLVQAFAMLRKRRKISHRLLILGDDRRGKPALIKQCSQLGIEDCTDFVSSVEQSLLANIYAAAEVLVMPSRAEGFGLPVLEAMACGTPVACSNAASLPEVAGNAAEYFDPSSVEEMAAAIDRILGAPSLQQELRARSLKQAAKFSWRESARQHAEVYRAVLQAGKR